MSVGSILFGIAVLAVVGAYVARPFRWATGVDVDHAVESWVAQLRRDEKTQGAMAEKSSEPVEGETDGQTVNYCPQCGRRVSSDDRFCSGCGTRLERETGCVR